MADQSALKDFGLCSFSAAGGARSAGLAIDGRVIALQAFAGRLPDADLFLKGGVIDVLQHWDRAWPLLQKAADLFRGSDALKALSAAEGQVRLHSPVEAPSAIYCAGANYKEHVAHIIMKRFPPEGSEGLTEEELKAKAYAILENRIKTVEPFYFLKANATLTGPFDDIYAPPAVKEFDWELELSVVIGRRAHRITEDQADDHIAGYAIGHDLTARDRQMRDPNLGMDWLQSKSLPSFFPFGPYLVPRQFAGDPQNLRIVMKLNGEAKQDDSTDDMITPVRKLVAYLSQWVPLNPGDIIATGSPAGNGASYDRYLQPGDEIECSITGLGMQKNRVVAEPGA